MQPPPSLFLVISPGKHITATTLLVNKPQSGGKLPHATIIHTTFEICAYMSPTTPNMFRAKSFVRNVVENIKSYIDDTGNKQKLTAILVRTPPPPGSFGRPQFLQENTWMEAFLIGNLCARFDKTPIQYVHPKDVRDDLFPGVEFETWYDEEVASVALSQILAASSSPRHHREALCIMVAIYYYNRFISK